LRRIFIVAVTYRTLAQRHRPSVEPESMTSVSSAMPATDSIARAMRSTSSD
jgi:hypothetical protein